MCSFGRVFRFSKASYNALTSSFIAEQKIRWCNAKGDGKENGKKTLHVQNTFFNFFAVVLDDYSMKLPLSYTL